MNCELAHERIVTGAYGELPDDQAHELDRHLAECAGCRQEREQLLALKVLADALPVVEPGPNLVARSRLRLDEALDALPAMHWYERVVQRLMNSVAGLQAAPLAACLLLVAGLGAGGLGGFEFAQNRAAHAAAAAPAVATAKAGASAGHGGRATRNRQCCQYFRHCEAAGHRDGGSELQPAGAAGDRRIAGRS